MVTFSLCMIVKNEAAVLRRCLSSIADLMDEIIIVDTGSNDDTKEIAAEFTDKIYDYAWTDDFAAARNFAFSKATMEYIYSADADEVVDEENHIRFQQLKQVLMPEVEIVQMYYVTPPEYNTASNFMKEYRPKLYRRLRTFRWIDAVHETVCLEPVVFDSEIEILHLPQSMHSSRDFRLFGLAFAREGRLSAKLHSMYAKELFISGEDEDFAEAIPVFEATLVRSDATGDMIREAICVLCHAYRIAGQTDRFFSMAFKLMPDSLCAELCCEVGSHFFDRKDYQEAIQWFETAAYRTEAVIDIRRSGAVPLSALSACYGMLAKELQPASPIPLLPEHEELIRQCEEQAGRYRKEADEWRMPTE